jgi:hypothetical protein
MGICACFDPLSFIQVNNLKMQLNQFTDIASMSYLLKKYSLILEARYESVTVYTHMKNKR